MRAWLLASVGVMALAAAHPAGAADLGVPYRAPPPVVAPPVVFSWTGFYFGGNVGGAWSHTDYTSSTPAGADVFNGSFDLSGWFGGGQVGFNYQFAPSFVLGVEADGEASDITGNTSGCTVTGCASSRIKADDFGTVRGRLGWAWNNVLLYGTGGWAFSHSTTDRTIDCVGPACVSGGPSFPSPLVGAVATASGTQSGWAAGAGIEWAFLPSWTVRVQYLHLQFDNINRTFVYPGFPGGTRTSVANTDTDTVGVGLNYLFNWWGGPRYY
jgi:outer membrane immunogenic protein